MEQGTSDRKSWEPQVSEAPWGKAYKQTNLGVALNLLESDSLAGITNPKIKRLDEEPGPVRVWVAGMGAHIVNQKQTRASTSSAFLGATYGAQTPCAGSIS